MLVTMKNESGNPGLTIITVIIDEVESGKSYWKVEHPQRLEKAEKIRPSGLKFVRGADGAKMNTIGSKRIETCFLKKLYIFITVDVVQGMAPDIVLGVEFLSYHEVHPSSSYMKLRGEIKPFSRNEDTNFCCVTIKEAVSGMFG